MVLSATFIHHNRSRAGDNETIDRESYQTERAIACGGIKDFDTLKDSLHQ
jgi:hypothetical protein